MLALPEACCRRPGCHPPCSAGIQAHVNSHRRAMLSRQFHAHPVVFSCRSRSGSSAFSRSQGTAVMMPAPSPETVSAEHAPRCSMHDSASSACAVFLPSARTRSGHQQAGATPALLCRCRHVSHPSVTCSHGGLRRCTCTPASHLLDDCVVPLISQVRDEAHLPGIERVTDSGFDLATLWTLLSGDRYGVPGHKRATEHA